MELESVEEPRSVEPNDLRLALGLFGGVVGSAIGILVVAVLFDLQFADLTFVVDGELMPARVIKAPWLSRLEPYGDDVSCVLETPRGNIEIQGQTWVSTFAMGRPNMPPNFPVLQQTGVRYRWDGEESFGMMERSIRKDKLIR